MDMNTISAAFQQSLFPLSHSKILHLVRHAQGEHNVAGEKDHDALLSPEFFDAHLSPLGLQQAMQTAVGVFGEGTSDFKGPPILAVEYCRERTGVHPCDKRRAISESRSHFPQIDFSLIEIDDDILWKADHRETDEEVAARGMKFITWLNTRQEKEIAIVTHNRFLQQTLNALTTDCHSSIRTEICKEFRNCELRSMVLVDKRY